MRIIAALTAALLFVVVAAACSGGSGSKAGDEGITGPARQTQEALAHASRTQIGAADASITPTIPGELSSPETLMFCVPLQQSGHEGPGQPVALAPIGDTVVYKPGTCEPDINADGGVLVEDDVAKLHVQPEYAPPFPDVDRIVWTPAKGELNGVPTVVTGKFIKTDAEAKKDQIGQSLVIYNFTDDGEQVFSSLTKRIGSQTEGLPLAVFLDGEPIRLRQGDVFAPHVLGEITDTAQVVGLSGPDARNLAALINSGMLR